MESFRSRHYPRNRNKFALTQENALPYYGGFLMFVLLTVVLRMSRGQEVLWFAVIGTGLAALLGSFFGGVRMRKRIAEIFFTGESYSVISIHDIVNKQPAASFPLKFANPIRQGNEIHIHYLDQILILRKEDWGEDFDIIWTWLTGYQPHNPMGFTQSSTGDF